MSSSENHFAAAVNTLRSSLYSLIPDSLKEMLARFKAGSSASRVVNVRLGYVY